MEKTKTAKIANDQQQYASREQDWLTNPFRNRVFLVEAYGDGLDYFCLSALLCIDAWKSELNDIVGNGVSSDQTLSLTEEQAVNSFIDSQDDFLTASLVFEIANYLMSDLNTTLTKLNGHKVNAKEHRDQAAQSQRIVKACRQIQIAYRTLTNFGLYPGPGYGVGKPNFLQDVAEIMELYAEDLKVLGEIRITRTVNGIKQSYEIKGRGNSKRSRYQDAPKYLILHLRELIVRCLDLSVEDSTTLLLPLAIQFGAISPGSNPESLIRALKKCDLQTVKKDFFSNWDAIMNRIGSFDPTICSARFKANLIQNG